MLNPTQTLTLIDRILRIAAKKAGRKTTDALTGRDDPFNIDKKLPGPLSIVGRIKGLSGAEAAADEVIAKLRDSGVDPKQINYGRIVDEIEKGVLRDGLPVDKVKDSIFELERKRIDAESTDPTLPRDKPDPKAPSPEENGPSEGDEASEKDPVDPSDSGVEGGADGAGTNRGLSAGTDADLDTPEARGFMKDLLGKDGPLDDILLKCPEDLTEGEVRAVAMARMDLPPGPEQEELGRFEKAFFDAKFGTGPVQFDAVGRMVEPQPIQPINKDPVEANTLDGEPLETGLKSIGRKVVRDAKADGLASVIRRLQGGLNILADAPRPPVTVSGGRPLVPKRPSALPRTPPLPRRSEAPSLPLPQLNEDGVFGPKTRTALRRAISTLGRPKVEEGMALGRFNDFARDGRREGFGRLAEVTENAFGPLFRDPAKPPRRPTDRLEGVSLQETLNDLGGKDLGGGRFQPLKLDGNIGPRTTRAFDQIAHALGPERLTRRFGEFLSFV